jgi:MFS family permease
MSHMSSPQQHDTFFALRFRGFRLLVTGKFIGVLGEQMLHVAIGWELYERTGSALALGLVGFVQVLPVFLFALPAGHIADQFQPRKVIALAQALHGTAALSLAALSYYQGPLWLIYLCLFAFGAARAFHNPCVSSLTPHLVTPAAFPNAAAWSSSAWQLAVIVGPALGGMVIGLTHRATLVYVLDVVAGIIFLSLVLATRARLTRGEREAMSLRSLAAGTIFIRRTKVILAAITLDMFAVLLGGATALLPVFAKDILTLARQG